MAAPVVTITSVSHSGGTVVVKGTATGAPTGGSLSITPAGVPNGAVAASTTAITFNSLDDSFISTLNSVANGNYLASTVQATNAGGTGSDTGPAPFTMYANGTLAPGMGSVDLRPFSAPTFNAPSLADGVTITTVTLENTSASAANSQPFTFGQPFKQGQLRMSDSIVGKIAGQADVALQFDPKATWPDGSVRHGIISGILPSIAGSALVQMGLARSTAARSNTGVSAATVAASSTHAIFTATIAGVVYTANADSVLNSGSGYTTWLSGPVCTECIVTAPLKDGGGVAHPLLVAQFCIRYYPSIGKAKVDSTIENGKAYSPSSGDVTYDASLSIGGTTVYTKAGLVHWHACRWKKTFWSGAATALHVKLEVPYILDSKMLPNYDRTLMPSDAALQAKYVTALANYNIEPMGTGQYNPHMEDYGGRPDIGLAPQWHAHWVISQDKRAANFAKLHSDVAGSWAIHLRDDSAGPAKGQPLEPLHWPYVTKLGTPGDSNNPATGQAEKLPDITSAANTNPDASHHPAFGFVPYMFTGDYFYLEELAFWGAWCVSMQNCVYRQFDRALMIPDQLRAQAWTMRDFGELSAIMPDAHPQKSTYRYFLDCNLDYYNANYTDNANANRLGIIVDGYTVVYNNNMGIAPWQDDFFTQAIGHCGELGFMKATRLLAWKARFQIGRLVDNDHCYQHAASYSLNVRPDGASPYYTDLGTCYNNTMSAATLAAACGSQALANQIMAETTYVNVQPGEIYGYADGNTGYPSNYLPALSMCIDVNAYPHTDVAWDTFKLGQKRPPNYADDGPQFAILPRGAAVVQPAPPPSNPQGTRMPIANRVEETTSSTALSVGSTINLLGKMDKRRAFSTGFSVGTLGISIAIEDDSGNYLEGKATLTSATVLTLTSITDTSLGTVTTFTFPAGTQRVLHDLLAEDFAKFATMLDPVATTLADPTTSRMLMEEGGLPKRIAFADAVAADGISDVQLPAASSIPDTMIMVLTDPTTGLSYKSTVGALKSIFGSTSPAETLAIGAIATPQTVGAAFTVSGTWTGVQPTGLNYALTDNGGTQGAWNTATGATINANGTWSFSQNPASASTSRTMVVQDSGHTNIVSAPSNAYVVNAAVADTTAPTASSAAVANAAPTVVAVTFSEAMNTSSVPAAAAFTVGGHTVSSVAFASGSSTILNVTVSAAFVNGEAARTLAYTQPGTNNLRDVAGNLLANITSLAITNNVAAAGTTYTASRYDGGTVPLPASNIGAAKTISAAGAAWVYSNASDGFTGVGYNLMGLSPAPAQLASGWGHSNTAPPSLTTTGATQTGSNVKVADGYVTIMTAQGGSDASHTNVYPPDYVWLSGTPGTYPLYYWLVPCDVNGNQIAGAAVCMNAANPWNVTVTA